jgi:hypothetical protein
VIAILASFIAAVAVVVAVKANRRTRRFEQRCDAILQHSLGLPSGPPPGRRTRTRHLHAVTCVKGVAA